MQPLIDQQSFNLSILDYRTHNADLSNARLPEGADDSQNTPVGRHFDVWNEIDVDEPLLSVEISGPRHGVVTVGVIWEPRDEVSKLWESARSILSLRGASNFSAPEAYRWRAAFQTGVVEGSGHSIPDEISRCAGSIRAFALKNSWAEFIVDLYEEMSTHHLSVAFVWPVEKSADVLPKLSEVIANTTSRPLPAIADQDPKPDLLELLKYVVENGSAMR